MASIVALGAFEEYLYIIASTILVPLGSGTVVDLLCQSIETAWALAFRFPDELWHIPASYFISTGRGIGPCIGEESGVDKIVVGMESNGNTV